LRARAYKGEPFAEFEVLLDSVPIDFGGREVTVNFIAKTIDNNNTFYVDSNGLGMIKRVLNHRDSFNISTF
jgi:hypothetical protein